MKIETYQYPHSSFLAVEKDLTIIVDHILKNERLKKLLFYTTRDCLRRPNIGDEETFKMFNKEIKIVPKLYVDKSVLNYIIISFDTFTTNGTNPEYRDNMINFDIVCHFDQWQLEDNQLRPYRIAAELDSMFNKKHLSGIGETQFLGATQIILNDEFAGLSLLYQAIHGNEDKKNALNPKEQQDININFDQIFNV